MTVLEIVTAKLTDTEDVNADATRKELAIAEADAAIKNYCNIDRIPEELNFVRANMAVDILRHQLAVAAKDSDDIEFDATSVHSIKVGDTSINLGGSTDPDLTSHRNNLDNLIMNYREQLNGFRRMVW